MADVQIRPDAQQQRGVRPLTIQDRINDVIVRLSKWPHVSGVKPLNRELKENFRLRTGD